MAIGPTLETERLILRPPAPQDFEPWCAFHADAEVMTYLGGVQDAALTWRSICTMTGAWTIEGCSMFSIIEKASGQWIGRIGAWHPHGWPGNEVGWGLDRSAWGKGFAFEGAAACMDYVVKELGWTEIIHTIQPGNASSVKLAERLGSRFLRSAPGHVPFEDMVWDIYGQSANDWRSRSG